MSRLAILDVLIDFAMSLLKGFDLASVGFKSVVAAANKFCRISRWVRIAIYVSDRIDHGALDAPRPPKPKRTRKPEATAEHEPAESLRDSAETDRPRREYEHYERYLDMPFGELVKRMCKA